MRSNDSKKQSITPLIALLVILVFIFTFVIFNRVRRETNTKEESPMVEGAEYSVTGINYNITGLHVSGNKIVNGSNEVVRLIGVNRSGTEYACLYDQLGDGPYNQALIDAMKTWGFNAIRVPLNEHCWLGRNGVSPSVSGENYRVFVENFVNLAVSNNMAVILDLHWAHYGSTLADSLTPMPNHDHSVDFWVSVANRFKNNSAVIFDLYNEPYPRNNEDPDPYYDPAGAEEAWGCWRDGDNVNYPTNYDDDFHNDNNCRYTFLWDNYGNWIEYEIAGMQDLLDAVRSTGATNIVIASGIQYASSLSLWLDYKPNDPTGNLVAGWHEYPNGVCDSPSQCWNTTILEVAAEAPIIVGEYGDTNCTTDSLDVLLPFLESAELSYLAWTWNTWGCENHQLMEDYLDGTPTANYGQKIYDHIQNVIGGVNPTLAPTVYVSVTTAPTSVSPSNRKSKGDFNNDGRVNISDLSILATNWNQYV